MRHNRLVRLMQPGAMLDSYEILQAAGQPCYYIRTGPQGHPISAVCPTPRAAWEDAHQTLSKAAKTPPAPKLRKPKVQRFNPLERTSRHGEQI